MSVLDDPEFFRSALREFREQAGTSGSVMEWCRRQEVARPERLCSYLDCIIEVTGLRVTRMGAEHADLHVLLFVMMLLGARLQKEGVLPV